MQSADEKDLRIKQLEDEKQEMLEKISRLEHNVEVLTQAVLHAAKKKFGASSEKTPQTQWQCSIFGEEYPNDLNLIDTRVINIKEHKRPVRKKGDREKLIAELKSRCLAALVLIIYLVTVENPKISLYLGFRGFFIYSTVKDTCRM